MIIDFERLRDYLLDLCGTAMMSGCVPALLDVAEVERADGYELIRIAEQFGVDVRGFEVG